MAAAAGARAAAACRSSPSAAAATNSSSRSSSPMPQCAVATCRNSHRKTRGRRVRYHRFPVEAEARGRWVSACGRGRDGAFNASTARVCSLHFSARSYERDVQHELLGLPPRSRLRRGAVPDRAVPRRPEGLDGDCGEDEDDGEEEADHDVSNPSGGIDVLLALGLTPIPRAERERRRRQEAAEAAATAAAAPAAEAVEEEEVKAEEEEDKPSPAATSVADAADAQLNRMHVMTEEEGAASPKTEPGVTAEAADLGSPLNTDENTKPLDLKQEVKQEHQEADPETQQPEPHPLKRHSTDSDSGDNRKRARSPEEVEVEMGELEEEEDWQLRAASAVGGGRGGGGGGRGGGEEGELRQLAERLRKEIGALAALARAKEHEWNTILRLKKLKEESLVRLQRRRQVLLIEAGMAPESCGPAAIDSDIGVGVMGSGEDINHSSPPRANGRPRAARRTAGGQHQSAAANRAAQPLMMVPIVSSSPGAAGERRSGGSAGRPLLPKPAASGSPPQQQSQQNPVIGEGRQGPILDVRSIIADYRSKNPGDVPRRGRRLRGALSPTRNQDITGMQLQSTRVSGSGGVLSMASIALGSGSQMRPGPAEVADLSFHSQDVSRPSSTDSSRGDQPGISFKDVLMQFARLSQENSEQAGAGSRGGGVSGGTGGAPFPEVTLHPVAPGGPPPSASPPPAAPAPAPTPPAGRRASLLHGILSGQARARSSAGSSTPTTFSPTLARLLTAPERHPGPRPPTAAPVATAGAGSVSIADLLSTNKTRNEITITPVSTNSVGRTRQELVCLEEQEDSADRDRLVIDEGETEADLADDVPECQGCHQMAAQFVCAGCGNQWYCSRDCQVAAWDEHSEVCSG